MCVRYRSEDRPSSLVRVWRDLFHRWPRREETGRRGDPAARPLKADGPRLLG